MLLVVNTGGFAPTPPTPKGVKGYWNKIKQSRAGKYGGSKLQWVSGHRKSSIFIFSLIILLILIVLNYFFIEGLLWGVFSNILWWAFIIFIGVLSYLQFKNDKIKSGILFLIIVIVLIAYRISYTFGFLGDFSYFFSSLSSYYTSLFPTLPIWFLVFAIILIILAIYNFKKGKAGVAVLIIGLIFVLWLFLPYIQTSLGPQLETRLGGGADVIKSFFTVVWEGFKNPQDFIYNIKNYFSFRNPDVQEKEPMKGLKFLEFKSRNNFYFEGQEVALSGRVHIDAIKQPNGETEQARVTLYCVYGDKTNDEKEEFGKIRVGRVDTEYKERSEIVVDESMDYSFSCKFEKGFKLDSNKKIDTKTVRAVGIFDNFVTISNLIFASVLRDKEEDYLEKVKTQFGETKQAKPVCKSGCALTRLSLETERQPLVEDAVFPLDARLLSSIDWYGDIEKIESIKIIKKPNKIRLEDDCELKEGDTNKKRIEYYNEELKKNKEAGASLDFRCYFTVQPTEDFETSSLSVEAKYDYSVEMGTHFDIKKRA